MERHRKIEHSRREARKSIPGKIMVQRACGRRIQSTAARVVVCLSNSTVCTIAQENPAMAAE
jgi:hypothetical protein